LEDQFVALQGRECDPAASLEQLVLCREGALGHLARGPGNLGDILSAERGTEGEWHCRHNHGSVLYWSRDGVRGDPFVRQQGGHTAHRDGEQKKEEAALAHSAVLVLEEPPICSSLRTSHVTSQRAEDQDNWVCSVVHLPLTQTPTARLCIFTPASGSAAT